MEQAPEVIQHLIKDFDFINGPNILFFRDETNRMTNLINFLLQLNDIQNPNCFRLFRWCLNSHNTGERNSFQSSENLNRIRTQIWRKSKSSLNLILGWFGLDCLVLRLFLIALSKPSNGIYSPPSIHPSRNMDTRTELFQLQTLIFSRHF